MAHWDLRADRTRVAAMAPGPTGQHPYVDNLIRLSKVPGSSRSRRSGAVCVEREASLCWPPTSGSRRQGDRRALRRWGRVRARGGAMARLARLVGRGRAAEILLGGDDCPAELAERYGYVNRVLPDAGRSAFVDAFARRIAGSTRRPIAPPRAADVASLPPDDDRPGLRRVFPHLRSPRVGARRALDARPHRPGPRRRSTSPRRGRSAELVHPYSDARLPAVGIPWRCGMSMGDHGRSCGDDSTSATP